VISGALLSLWPRYQRPPGWRLRLQYLRPEKAIDRNEISAASDFGSDLRDYVLDPPSAGRA